MSDIPKIIYYCWFGGDKSQKVLDCIDNWKEKLHDYQIVEINEKNKELFDVEKECQNNLWFKTVWENKMWAYVADYARLKVLYERGGVYFDTDITVEKDITELLEKNKLVIGWEDKQSINIAAGVIICKEKNILIKEMFDFYNNEIWHSKLYTIPHIVTHVIKKYYKINLSTEITENDDILILPQEYFYPIPVGFKEKGTFVTKNSYTIHWWNASWVKPNFEYFLKYKHRIKLLKLLQICFKERNIFNNYFLKIDKIYRKIYITIDFSYMFKFKHQYQNKKKYLTIFVFGIPIKLFCVKRYNKGVCK